ncbi:MAG: hypothetical protein E4H14_06400 [Candidatus Thorarchaeota archaeon]|nr:MAG: hypothetical protein E4H14_06400 [Candidatus Thorarchaeota archaeon]
MSGFTRSVAYYWALTGIFGAFHLVLTFIPFSVLGMGGGFLTWGMVSAAIVGFLLGPFYGTIAVLVGSIIGTGIFNLGGFLGPIVPILAPTAGAFAAGALRTNRLRELFVLFLVAIIGYIISPIGITAFTFIWLHLITFFIVVILLVPKLMNKLIEGVTIEKDRNLRLMPFAILLFSFIALMTDHIVGNTATVYYLFYFGAFDAPTLAAMWLPITFVYPLERLVATIALAVIVIAASEAIVQTGLELPISPWDSRESLELTPEEVENG